jgi:hypothetical protein
MTPIAFVPIVLTFAIVAGFTINRLNSPVPTYGTALRGKARGIAYSGICLTAGYFVILPPVYAAVDSMMPIPNGADLLAKYLVLAAVAFLGSHMSRAYGSRKAHRWIAGRPGIIVFALVAIGLLWTLLASNTTEPSPQLSLYTDLVTVKIHTWLVVFYIAYVVSPIIVPAYKDSKVNPLRAGRMASGLIAFGFFLSLLRLFTYAAEFTSNGDVARAFTIVSHLSTIFVVVGLALFAYARKKGLAQQQLESSLSIN